MAVVKYRTHTNESKPAALQVNVLQSWSSDVQDSVGPLWIFQDKLHIVI